MRNSMLFKEDYTGMSYMVPWGQVQRPTRKNAKKDDAWSRLLKS